MSKKAVISLIFSLVILVCGSLVHGSSVHGTGLSSQVQTVKLSNGMLWLIVTRPGIPIFSGLVLVRAGGADEVEGKTGLAHMFEHMAFKGSKTIGTKNYAKELPILGEIAKLGREMAGEQQKKKPDEKKIAELKAAIQKKTREESEYIVNNEVWSTLSRKGAEDLNAFTTKDVTAFHANMPVEQFPLWARFASEMVFDPVLREFYQERDVVMEERRLRYDNSPHGFLWEQLVQAAYPSGPYSFSPIGTWKDLKGLTMEDAATFHRCYYVPSNIVGVLVGALTPAAAKPELEKYFGRFPSGKIPPDKTFPDFSFHGEKRKTISFPAEPALLIAFHKPKAPSKQDYVFDILDELLCEGRTGRLYKKLVKDEKIAASLDCSNSFPGSRFDNLFVILASSMKGHSLEELEASIEEELEAVTKEIPSEELQKVRQEVVYNFFWGLENNMQLAEQLATAQAVLKDWRYVANYPQVIQSIGFEEIKNTAAKYFSSENRVVIYRVRGKR